MHEEKQKEEFSHAYVMAVAAGAGFSWSKPSADDDSIDLCLHQKGGKGVIRSPKLDLQLKCTAQNLPEDPEFSFALKIKNYNDLRIENLMTPRILVVLLVPDHATDWIFHSEEEMALRRCGYWMSLRGMRESRNEKAQTIRIPRAQTFNVQALKDIMAQIEQGGLP